MGDALDYALVDLVPFSAQVYFRLVERFNDAYWPLHLATLVAGLALPLLLRRGHGRAAGLLLAALWGWVGYGFFSQYYANLNWAGQYAGVACWLQGLLLVLLAGAGRWRTPRSWRRPAPLTGLLLVAAGLLHPLIAPLTGRGWAQAEVFGMHPDATALATLGLGLIGLRGWTQWLAALVPLLWSLATGLTLMVLQAPWAPWPLAAAGVAVLVMVGQACADLTRGRPE